MHRIDTPTAQKDKFGQGKNGFTNGDPATGRRATDLNSDMWDAVQEEVCTVIEAAGIQLSKGEHTQLHAAIGRLIDEQVKTRLEKNQNGADIPNKPLFLQNVGLEETINLAAGALQKDQNGADIPDKGLFAQNIGAALAFSGGIHIGGDSNPWTTANLSPGWSRKAYLIIGTGCVGVHGATPTTKPSRILAVEISVWPVQLLR